MESLTPMRIGLVLLVATLIAPQVLSYYHGPHKATTVSLSGFLWTFSYSSDHGFRLLLTDLTMIPIYMLFFGPGFLFVYQVVRYCQEEAGRRSTVVLGIVTMCPVLFMVTIPYLWWGFGLYVIPLPTLLITGLVVMHYTGPKEPTTPWEGLD